jgi:adenosine deaminase
MIVHTVLDYFILFYLPLLRLCHYHILPHTALHRQQTRACRRRFQGITPLANPDLWATIRALPKIELHRHFEGSVRLATLADVARKYRLAVPDYDAETLRPFVQVMPNDPRTSDVFLSKFHVLRQFFCSLEVIERISYEIIEDAAADNIRYMELRFTPRALCSVMECSMHSVMPIVCATVEQAARDYGIHVRLIVSMNRHEPAELGEEALRAALDNQTNGVVGLDLAGDEANYSATPFRPIFQQAHAAGLGTTVHAGEWSGAHSVWDAVGNLGADRVGHGTRIFEDAAMVQVIAQRGVTFEVCPTSNVSSGVIQNFQQHPLLDLNRSNVPTTLNTDDPGILNITLSDEIYHAMTAMHMTLDDIKQHMLRAARAAFLPDDERARLTHEFENLFTTV